MLACLALRATTNNGRVEAGCCATLMRRAASWPETSSRHVRRVASRLPSPPLASVTNAASAAHEQPSLRYGCTKPTRIAAALFRCHSSWPHIAARSAIAPYHFSRGSARGDTRPPVSQHPFPNSRFRTFEFEPAPCLIFREARGAGDFVHREGGFRDLRLMRTEGRSDKTAHGEGRLLDFASYRNATAK